MTSFSRQNPLKSKNKHHPIVCNSKVCYVAKFELHWIKNTKVIPRVPLQASCWPGVKSTARFPAKKRWHSLPPSGCLGIPLPLPQSLCGRTDVRMYGRQTDGHVTITSQPKFLGLIGYQISLGERRERLQRIGAQWHEKDC